MKVLISGGVLTRNIVDGISKKFTSSGVEFIVEPFIENIDSIYARGEYFDRAIIIEQSWTADYQDNDEYSWRNKINTFARQCRERMRQGMSLVFLTQTKEQAALAYEETFDVRAESIVVIKKPKYKAVFFNSLINFAFADFPESIVYKAEEDLISGDPDVTFDPTTVEPEYIPESGNMPGYGTGDIGDIGMGDIPDDLGQGYSVPDIGHTIPTVQDDPINPEDDPLGDVDWGRDIDWDNPEPSEPSYQPEFDVPRFGDIPDMTGGVPEMYPSDEGSGESLPEDSIPWDEDDPLGIGDMIEPQDDNNGGQFVPADETGFMPDMSREPYEETYEPTRDPGLNGWGGVNESDIHGRVDQARTLEEAVRNPTFDPNDEYGNDPYSGDIPVYEGEPHRYGGGSEIEEIHPDESVPMGNRNPVSSDPYGAGMGDNPYGSDPYGAGSDPYGADPYGSNPYGGGNPYGTGSNPYDDPYRESVADEDPQYREEPTVIRENLTNEQIRAALQAFAARGNSIVCTGCGGAGTSTVAFGLANTLCNLGYSVLLVDMDTMGRTQSYISKDNYDSMEPDAVDLIAAVNSSTGISGHMAIVRQGFHLLSLGMAGELNAPDKVIHKQKLMRFASTAKNGHDFVIYDIPFDYAVDFFSDIIHMCDNIVLTIDASNWGVTKTMMNVCNIQSEDMQDAFFNRAQIVFNKYRGNNRFFGKKVRSLKNVPKEMDNKVAELIGEEPDYYFKDMQIAGVIDDSVEFESGWYARKQYSDTKKGQPIFIELVKRILLRESI